MCVVSQSSVFFLSPHSWFYCPDNVVSLGETLGKASNWNSSLVISTLSGHSWGCYVRPTAVSRRVPRASHPVIAIPLHLKHLSRETGARQLVSLCNLVPPLPIKLLHAVRSSVEHLRCRQGWGSLSSVSHVGPRYRLFGWTNPVRGCPTLLLSDVHYAKITSEGPSARNFVCLQWGVIDCLQSPTAEIRCSRPKQGGPPFPWPTPPETLNVASAPFR